MYYYQPPKSAIWGHRLGRLHAAHARELLQKFFAAATANVEFRAASLFGLRNPPESSLDEDLAEFAPTEPTGLSQLTRNQSDACVDIISAWEDQNSGHPTTVGLLQAFEVTTWNINERLVPTTSLFHMNYGSLPCISTFLQFESTTDFDHVRTTLAEVGLCALNPKHLKFRKNSRANR